MNRILMMGALLWIVAALMACSGVDPGKCVQDFDNYTCKVGSPQDGGSEAAQVGQSPQPPIPNPDACWLCNMAPGTNGSFNTCTGQAGSCDDTRAHCSVIPIKCFYDAATCGYQCSELGAYDTCTGMWDDCATSLRVCGTVPLSCPDAGPVEAGVTCGPTCTAAGLFDPCSGAWGTCADSLAKCGVAPAICHDYNVCYQPDAAGVPFAVECNRSGDTDFTWTDTVGVSHDCHDGTKCLSGSTCQVHQPGVVPFTGVCY